ncbi:MAG: hypothetical protein V4608_14730 [Bacteroidota bacterium]
MRDFIKEGELNPVFDYAIQGSSPERKEQDKIHLTKQEQVLNKLADAWNLFKSIPKNENHVCDADEFCKAIHAAQNIMFAQIVLNTKHDAVARLKKI